MAENLLKVVIAKIDHYLKNKYSILIWLVIYCIVFLESFKTVIIGLIYLLTINIFIKVIFIRIY